MVTMDVEDEIPASSKGCIPAIAWASVRNLHCKGTEASMNLR
jgi:hypothetical protein